MQVVGDSEPDYTHTQDHIVAIAKIPVFQCTFQIVQKLVLLLILIVPLGLFLFAEGQEFGGYVHRSMYM